jgi:hypothetical protein
MFRSLRRGGIFAASLFGVLGVTQSASADVGDFLGNWVNQDSDTSGITHVVISPAGGNQVTVQVFGQCHPTDCDWGTVPGHNYYAAVSSGDVRMITASFNTGFAHKFLVFREAHGGKLAFEALTDFTDGSGRQDYDIVGKLVAMGGPPPGGGYGPPPGPPPGGGYGPPPPPPGGGYGPPPGPPPGPSLGAEDCIGLNPGTTQAAFVGGDWKVVDGGNWLLDFGGNAAGAHRAADIIHHYKFNQQCFVVRPNASMTYWKRNGFVPGGNMGGEDCVGLNPNTASVAHVGGDWKVVDGPNWILDYGNDKGAAFQALAVIQNYHLNRQCFVARPNPPMQYWLAQ